MTMDEAQGYISQLHDPNIALSIDLLDNLIQIVENTPVESDLVYKIVDKISRLDSEQLNKVFGKKLNTALFNLLQKHQSYPHISSLSLPKQLVDLVLNNADIDVKRVALNLLEKMSIASKEVVTGVFWNSKAQGEKCFTVLVKHLAKYDNIRYQQSILEFFNELMSKMDFFHSAWIRNDLIEDGMLKTLQVLRKQKPEIVPLIYIFIQNHEDEKQYFKSLNRKFVSPNDYSSENVLRIIENISKSMHRERVSMREIMTHLIFLSGPYGYRPGAMDKYWSMSSQFRNLVISQQITKDSFVMVITAEELRRQELARDFSWSEKQKKSSTQKEEEEELKWNDAINNQRQEVKKEISQSLLTKAFAMLDLEQLKDARCVQRIIADLGQVDPHSLTKLQAALDEREKMSENELQARIDFRIVAVAESIAHADQQAKEAKSNEEKEMIERQTLLLRAQEAALQARLKELQEREIKVEQNEKWISEQSKHLTELLAELELINKADAEEMQQQMTSINKDISSAQLQFDRLQKKAKKVHEDLRQEERRQRERMELMEKQIQLYRVRGMSPDQLSFRNYLKSVKRLSLSHSQQVPFPLECFISYAWETDATVNAELQKRLKMLKDDLQVAGMKVKLDIRNMAYDMNQFMVQGIQQAHKILLICTPRLKFRASEPMQNNLKLELQTALHKAQTAPDFILPLLLSGSFRDSMPPEAGHLLSISFVPPKPSPPPPDLSTSPPSTTPTPASPSPSTIPSSPPATPSPPPATPLSTPSTPFATPAVISSFEPISYEHYYEGMAGLSPMGLIPMLLGLNEDKDYERTYKSLSHELELHKKELL